MAITRINNNQITDASTGNVYLGVNAATKLQDYTITSGKISNNLVYGSDLTISGNLTVNGNTTSIDTVNLVVEDPLILLAKEQTGTPTLDIGFIGERGTSNNIAFIWDENSNQFATIFTDSATTNTQANILSYASLQTDTLTAANANITGTVNLGNVTIGNIVGNLIVTGNTTSGNFLTAGLVSATGNVTGGNLNTGGVASVTGNVQAGNLRTAGLVLATGNVTGGNITTAGVVTATGNVTGGNLNTAGVASVTGNVIGGNLTTAGVVSATGNVTGGNITTAGVVTATGNVTGGNVISQALVQGVTLSSSGNVIAGNVNTAGLVSATGNVTGGNLNTGGVASVTGNVQAGNLRTTGLVSATGNVTGGNLISAALVQGVTVSASGNLVGGNANITSAVNSATVSASGNITGGNVLTGGQVSATGNVTGGNLVTAGTLSTANLSVSGDALVGGNLVVQGNLTYINIDDLRVEDPIIQLGGGPNGNALVSNDGKDRGTLLTYYTTAAGNAFMGWDNSTGNIIVANSVSIANDVITVTSYGTFQAGNAYLESSSVIGNVQAGNLRTAGLVSVTGNVNGGNLISAALVQGVTVSGSGNVIGGNVTTAGLVSATGNINGGNLISAALVQGVTVSASGNLVGGNANITSAVNSATVSASGNITGANLVTGGLITATGNITGGNLNTAGVASVTGNVQAGNLRTTGLVSATGNINGGNLISAALVQGVTVSASGNVIGGNLTTTGLVTATGNVTGGNITTGGLVTATGNVTGGNLNTGGVASVTGNVQAGNLRTTGLISATGNITGSNLILTSGFIDSSASRITINGSDADVDFAVDGDTVANIFYVDAGIGTAAFGNSSTLVNAVVSFNATSSILMPVGNTVQRPDPATVGMLRFTTAQDALEVYTSTGWELVGVPEFTVIVDDQFNGDAITTAFTLSQDATTAGVIVSINGVVQLPTVAYSVLGTTLTFTEAPSLTDVIDVRIITTTTTVTRIENVSADAVIEVSDISNDISITGDLIPTANVTYDLGSPTAYWKNGYFAGNTIFLGGLQLKDAGSNTFAVFTSDGITQANLDVGTIDVSAINSGTSAIGIAGTGGNAYITVGGTANVLVVSTGGTTTTGFVSATGNIVGGNLSGTNIVGTLTTAAQNNITSVGTLSSLTVTNTITGGNLSTGGSVSATGNVSGGNLVVTGNIVDTAALEIITGSNGNITLSPNGTGVIVLNKDLRNGQANGVGNIGSATGYFDTIFAKATSAQYADLAEMYEADAIYEPGTVLCFGGNKEVTACNEDSSRRVAGVVSTNPSYIMNAGLDGENVVAVALTGRVPCRVTGTVRKGDMMVAAGCGRARAEADPKTGSVIGKALADFDGIDGVIEVVVGRL
jgi:hypothetical protein